MDIGNSHFESLREIYLRCCKEIKVEPGTFLRTTMESSRNKIYRAILASRYEAGRSDPVAEFLSKEGYIRPIDGYEGQYTITAKGMWTVEEKCYNRSMNDIIRGFDDRFFRSEVERMTDKNKIILFATIAVHAFSENDGISYAEPGTKKVFIDMMEDSFEILHRLGRIDISSFESILKTNNSQKVDVACLTSSIDRLPRSTYSLFVSKKNCYYLNLMVDQSIDRTELRKVLGILFEDIGVSEIDIIMDGCREISINYGCYYHHSDDMLSSSEYDDAIMRSLLELAGL